MSRELSKEQTEAVNAIDGQVLVVSCPGSGKTTVIIERCKKMVQLGIDPKCSLNITFTKAAADEMEKRFSKESDVKMNFSTIHSFCYQLLCKEFHYSKEDILKESEKWMFVGNQLFRKIPPNEMDETIKGIMSEISFIKNKELPLKMFLPESCEKALFDEVYIAYEDYKKEMQKVDFDDMLTLCRDSLVNNPDILKKYQDIYKYITVDEFQDVNGIQSDICYMLAGDNGNLFVVGDDDQSIYKFRAANSSIMLNFPKKFPNCRTIYMGTNYRSGQYIVTVAGKLIEHNKQRFQKDFKAYREERGNLFTLKNISASKEAEDIANQLVQLNKQGMEYKDMAILYRNNNLNLSLIIKFMKMGIPFYTTEKPKSIHTDFIFEDIVAYYRLSKEQEKRGDLLRILNRPARYLKSNVFKNCKCSKESLLSACKLLGPQVESAKEKITDFIYDLKQLSTKKPIEFIEYLSNFMGYREWLRQYAEYRGKQVEDMFNVLNALRDEAKDFDTMEDWFKFAERYEKRLQEAAKSKNKDGVCLATFHASKGLEWKTVFVINVNNKITPYVKAEMPDDLEEERRAFYVAITRAKDNLYLSYLTGVNNELEPSQYFNEMGIPIAGKIGFAGGTKQSSYMDPKYGLGREKTY